VSKARVQRVRKRESSRSPEEAPSDDSGEARQRAWVADVAELRERERDLGKG